MRALITYFAVLVGVALVGEAVLRWQRPLFFAASHRALFKAASYRARGGSDVAFFGSSRTTDGVLPSAFGANSFNLGVSSSSIETLEWLVDYVAPVAPKRVAFIEVSAPQSASRIPDWLNDTAEGDLEGRLSRWMREHSAWVALRRSLRADGLGRLAALTFASRFDGSEVTASDYWAAVRHQAPSADDRIANTEAAPRHEHAIAHERGRLDRPSVEPPLPGSTADIVAAAQRYLAVAEALRGANPKMQIVFWVPPLRDGGPEREPAFKAILAHLRATAPVWDLSSQPVPAAWFHDAGHLNRVGATALSRSFAEWLDDAN